MNLSRKLYPSLKYGDGLKQVYTNIIEAINYNDLDGVIRALQESPAAINQTDAKGMSGLHWAVFQNNTEIASYLLDYKAVVDGKEISVNVRHEDRYRRNVVEFALQTGNDEMITLVNKHYFPKFYDQNSEWNSDDPPKKVVDFPTPDPER